MHAGSWELSVIVLNMWNFGKFLVYRGNSVEISTKVSPLFPLNSRLINRLVNKSNVSLDTGEKYDSTRIPKRNSDRVLSSNLDLEFFITSINVECEGD